MIFLLLHYLIIILPTASIFQSVAIHFSCIHFLLWYVLSFENLVSSNAKYLVFISWMPASMNFYFYFSHIAKHGWSRIWVCNQVRYKKFCLITLEMIQAFGDIFKNTSPQHRWLFSKPSKYFSVPAQVWIWICLLSSSMVVYISEPIFSAGPQNMWNSWKTLFSVKLSLRTQSRSISRNFFLPRTSLEQAKTSKNVLQSNSHNFSSLK